MRSASVGLLAVALLTTASVRADLVGVEHAVLSPKEGTTALAGWAVALDEDTAAVGAVVDGEPLSESDVGGVYVYVRSGSTWTRESRLFMLPEISGGRFGHAVTIGGGLIAVGAPDADGAEPRAGAVYVYGRDPQAWTAQTWLFAPDGGTGDGFGFAVALDGNTLAIGAPFAAAHGARGAGRVYIFERSGTIWFLQQVLVPPSDEPSRLFGFSLDLAVDTLLIGAPGDATVDLARESAFVFTRQGNAWRLTQELASSSSTRGAFGFDVTIDGAWLLVGAPRDRDASSHSGAAYAYRQQENGWVQSQRLTSSESRPEDHFGFSVDVFDDRAVVGVPGGHRDIAHQPRAVLFEFNGVSWAEQSTITPGLSAGGFGYSVALDKKAALVGAPYAYAMGGGAYAFRLGLDVGAVCPDETACAHSFCVDGVCCESLCGTGASDDCLACVQALTSHDDGLCRPVRRDTVCRPPICRAGVLMEAARCDGSRGTCPSSVPQTCAPYLCGAGACRSRCESDAGCTLGYRCQNGACIGAKTSHNGAGCEVSHP